MVPQTVDGATKFSNDSVKIQLADSDTTSTSYDAMTLMWELMTRLMARLTQVPNLKSSTIKAL
ncbi:hypothetical protein AWA2045_31410 (plasmid) [Lactiplantibacillus plantarum]|nr:hypothetical protein AWA2045_31410 [Lactiplantibacillus plantarum]